MPLLPPMDLPLVEKPEVVIDGRADESAWAQAAEASDFVVYRPQPGAEPSAKTRVRVMTSEEALYVHFEAKSPKPEDIRSGYGRRDSRRNDDYVGILLDTQGAPSEELCFSSIPWAYRETESSCAARMLRWSRGAVDGLPGTRAGSPPVSAPMTDTRLKS